MIIVIIIYFVPIALCVCSYHPVARKMVASDLKVDLSVQPKAAASAATVWTTLAIASIAVIGAIVVARNLRK